MKNRTGIPDGAANVTADVPLIMLLSNELLNHALFGVAVLSSELRFVVVTEAMAKIFAQPREQIIGRPLQPQSGAPETTFEEIVSVDRCRLIRDRAASAPPKVLWATHTAMSSLTTTAGSFLVHYAPLRIDSTSPPYIGVFVTPAGAEDETAAPPIRGESDSSQHLIEAISRARSSERTQISRELHDHIGQLVTGISLSLKALESSVDPSSQPAVIAISDIARQLGNDLHHFSKGLRPSMLDELGLAGALSEHLRTWSTRTRVTPVFCDVTPPGTKIPRHIELALYRMALEGLNNVWKHAGARRVAVSLALESNRLVLAIQDDGRGFHVPQNPPQSNTNGIGLIGVREQAEELGGICIIDASTPGGTTMRVEIPLRPDRSDY